MLTQAIRIVISFLLKALPISADHARATGTDQPVPLESTVVLGLQHGSSLNHPAYVGEETASEPQLVLPSSQH
jgi:hypothetical protein